MRSQPSLPKPRKPRLLVRRVVGDSMLPTFQAGQIVAIRRSANIEVGDVVMVQHEGLEKIKRVARLEPARIYLLGDNPAASTDSRNFGWLGSESIIGKVVWPRHSRRSH
jgi:nickel-type superoxide dismutase maturation protease